MRLPLQTSTLNAYTRACMKGCVAFPIVQIIAAQSPSPPAFLKLLTPQLTLESRLAFDRLVPLMTSTETQFESIHQAVLTYLFCRTSSLEAVMSMRRAQAPRAVFVIGRLRVHGTMGGWVARGGLTSG